MPVPFGDGCAGASRAPPQLSIVAGPASCQSRGGDTSRCAEPFGLHLAPPAPLQQVLDVLESLAKRMDHVATGQVKVEALVGEVQQNVARLFAASAKSPSAAEAGFGFEGVRPIWKESAPKESTRNRFDTETSSAPASPIALMTTRNASTKRSNRASVVGFVLDGDMEQHPPRNGISGLASGENGLSPGEERLNYLITLDRNNRPERSPSEAMVNPRGSFATRSQRSMEQLKDKARFEPEKVSTTIDCIMFAVIMINAVLLGASCDNSPQSSLWIVLDMIFMVIFTFEQTFKLWLFGIRPLLRPGMDVVDFMIVLLDLCQTVYLITQNFHIDSGAPSPSIFRLVRLARLGRLVRVYRITFVKELLVMIDGMVSGLTTLGWSMVLVLFPIYTVAIVLRETLGQSDEHDVSRYFSTVPRAIFTMFRCSFGDCSTAGGMPVFELVHETWGWGFSLCYSVFLFVITIGLFNVISAIFVENVIKASTENELRQKHRRLSDEGLLASRLVQIMRCMMGAVPMGTMPSHAKPEDVDDTDINIHSLNGFEITAAVFDEVLKDPTVSTALADLDICPEDHVNLFDILDSDNSGKMLFEELLVGLEKLRGEPRRSDIVCVDLMLRSIQQNVNEILKLATKSAG